MRAAASQAGLELDGRAERVTADAIADADLVLAMDRANLADLEALAASAGLTTPIRLFRAFDPEGGPGHDVPDPYDGPSDGFATVVDICRRTARALVADLDAALEGR
jgi:protein-tyrosine phosphatase